MWITIYKKAFVFEKLAQSTDLRLEIERAFPPEIYPPKIRATEEEGVYFGEIDDRFDLTVKADDNNIYEAIIHDNAADNRHSFETLSEAVNFYMEERKKPAAPVVKTGPEEGFDIISKLKSADFYDIYDKAMYSENPIILEKIANWAINKDIDEEHVYTVLISIAHNIHTPIKILKILEQHKHDHISESARYTLNILNIP